MKAMRKKNSRHAGRRWPRLIGLLVAGTAVGAGSAIALRRRGQQEWDEYDPGHALDVVREEVSSMTGGTLADPARPASEDSMPGGSATSAGESQPSSAGSATDSAKRAAKSADKAGGVLSNASGQSRNSRN